MLSPSIRNFSIIAHIDHGKSTLADRLLELTGTISPRRMRAQVLDMMDLERERGITIKMQPVRMRYRTAGQDYVLNLIDTPGHIDFSYEVSRALRAVEGVVLLVDATQGIEAQTITVLDLARQANLLVIPALNKIDLSTARVEETAGEVEKLLGVPQSLICRLSAKTGEGIPDLLAAIIDRVPAPGAGTGRLGEADSASPARGLVFDFSYSSHTGLIVYLRIFSGSFKKGDRIYFLGSGDHSEVKEVGVFTPERVSTEKLSAGEIGYLVTGIKDITGTKVGDTVVHEASRASAIPGYQPPLPVVWASFYPPDQGEFDALYQSLKRLQLSDSALSFEEETSVSLGRGFRVGFLGLLHLEIVTERLRREFSIMPVIASPTVEYRIMESDKKTISVYTPSLFPADIKNKDVLEPWIKARIIIPGKMVGGIMPLLYNHEAVLGETTVLPGGDRVMLQLELPLRELVRNFFDELKSASSGFASLSYEPSDWHPAPVVRLDILVGGEPVPAFSRVVARSRSVTDGRATIQRLKELIPRQLVAIKLQAVVEGRIVAAEVIPAWRKDVTGYLYGGDVTRKQKLLSKQKRGKQKMQTRLRPRIPQAVFLKMIQGERDA